MCLIGIFRRAHGFLCLYKHERLDMSKPQTTSTTTSKLAPWILATLGVLFLAFLWWSSPEGTEGPREAGNGLVLEDLNGKTVELNAEGKITIVNFWATWCGPCRKEIPSFVELQDKYASQGVEIVGIAMDSGTREDVRQFASAFGITYKILLGNEKAAGAYGGLEGYPTTFIQDRQGKIVRHYVGYRPQSVFEEDIKSLLAM